MPEFRSLAEILYQDTPVRTPPPVAQEPVLQALACKPPEDDHLREVRLFLAHVREALDRNVQLLLEGLASEVLGRELLLAPTDIATIVASALRRFTRTQTLRVRVHPQDAVLLEHGVPVFADESLCRGDAVIDLRNGSIDLTLASRLEELTMRRFTA